MNKTEFRYAIENNFNNDVIYTSSRGRDLKNDVRVEARKQGKLETDFKTIKL